MFARKILLSGLAIGLFLGTTQWAVAQQGNAAAMAVRKQFSQQQQQQQQQPGQPGQPMQAQVRPVNITGTIEGMNANGLIVRDGTQQVWQVGVSADTKVQLTGTATVDYLAKGVCIEFSLDIDVKGEGTTDLGALSIVTPSDSKQLGAALIGGGGKGKGPQPGMNHVVGLVQSCRENFLIVRAGKITVKTKLTDEPTIKVDLSDYSQAAKGDKVTITALAAATDPRLAQLDAARAQHLMAMAKDVKIELSEPLTSGTAKKKPASKAGGTNARAKKE